MAPTTKTTGGCLCGAVRYAVHGSLRPVVFCHCEQCRKTSGHFVAASACASQDLELIENDKLRWYQSSPQAQRGFCCDCGGNLFWRPVSGAHVSIMAGTIDLPTGITAIAHIYVGSASDYHEIDDKLPQYTKGCTEDLGAGDQ
ncbi:MAG: GFA family protein [Woeseiaceae bacterium]